MFQIRNELYTFTSVDLFDKMHFVTMRWLKFNRTDSDEYFLASLRADFNPFKLLVLINNLVVYFSYYFC